MPQKQNNRRRFPGENASYLRPDRAETRREEATARQQEYSKLSTQQKLELLDTKFGAGNGAKKQRNKLTKPATAPVQENLMAATPLPEEVLKEIELLNQEASKKKIKAKDRRKQEQKS